MGDTTCSGIRRLNILKMSVLNLVYRFNVVPVKMPAYQFEYFNKLSTKFI